MGEVFERDGHAELWHQAWRHELGDWDAIFDGYLSTTDWPGCTFYRELTARYPDAPVLLSVRDPDRWYESCLTTIYPASGPHASGTPFTPSTPEEAEALRRLEQTRRMINEIIWQGTFGGRFEDRAYALDVFRRHNEEVQRTVPPGRLLVYDVRQGWEPLCAFLGLPVPVDTPFPHLNTSADFLERRGQGPVPAARDDDRPA